MSRVGEAYRSEVGRKRSTTGFFAGAASLLGFGHLFRASETPASFLSDAMAAPHAPRAVPAFHAPEPQAASAPTVRVIHSTPMDHVAPPQGDETERLAAHIAGAGVNGRARRVLITHASSTETPLAGLDCAAFASQIARALACEGRTILVVFGTGGGMRPGLSELIDGSASFSEAIHREAGSRLHILPPGHGRAAPGPGLYVALDALSDTYDYVVLSAADDDADAVRRLAIALASRADHVLVGCPGQTGSPDMVALRDALKDEGAGEVIATRIGAFPVESREAA